MTKQNMWMIRAGKGSHYINEFIEHSIVAIGWPKLGDISLKKSRKQLVEFAKKIYPDSNKGQIGIFVGQVYRFLNEIKTDDFVITYDSSRRIYWVGVVKSQAEYNTDIIESLPRVRKVEWQFEVSRDSLSSSTKNTLGAISTLFKLSDSAADEIIKLKDGKSVVDDDVIDDTSDEVTLEAIKEQSKEYIKDKIVKLDPYQLQDLVAGVLRAMGYKTRVSPPGADRGVDILASPDGLGFEQPRIVVECKHRKGTIGSQDLRSFLGGRHKDDKGLYVSTGGFTREARYEAERGNIPVTLMDMDQLVNAICDHYEKMDTEVRTLLPLAKVYWPA